MIEKTAKKAEDKRKEMCNHSFEETLKRPNKPHSASFVTKTRSQPDDQSTTRYALRKRNTRKLPCCQENFNMLIKSMPVHRKVLGFVSEKKFQFLIYGEKSRSN